MGTRGTYIAGFGKTSHLQTEINLEICNSAIQSVANVSRRLKAVGLQFAINL